MTEMTLEQSLDKIAEEIATEIGLAEKFSDKVQAFRALSAYWAMKMKLTDPDDNEGTELHAIHKRITSASSGDKGSAGNGKSAHVDHASGGSAGKRADSSVGPAQKPN